MDIENKSDSVPMSDLTPSEFRFPESNYVALGEGGKVYSMREVCDTCMLSLTTHLCNTPTIHAGIPVTIKQKGIK